MPPHTLPSAPIRIADSLKKLTPLTQRPQHPSASQRFFLLLAIILTSCAPATTITAPTTAAAQPAETATSTPPSSATPERTATPPAAFTPEPSATPPPAEAGPTSCMDTAYIETHFVQPYLEQSGFADMPAAMATFREKYGKGESAWSHDSRLNYAESIVFSPVMYLGNYKVPFAMPGYSGTARCVVVAYPGSGDTVRVITVVTDATVNGKWSMWGVSGPDGLFYKNIYNIQKEEDMDEWMLKNPSGENRKPGDSVRIAITAASGPSKHDSGYNNTVYAGMRDLVLATYPGRFEADPKLMKEVAGDLEFPDPYDIFQWLDPKQDVGLIAGIGDPLNK